MLPEVSELRHIPAGDVVGDRHTGQLDDSAFDGVHEREVAHGPREERSFWLARTAEEEWRRGEVHHPGNAELALDDFKSGYPQPGGLVVLLGLLLFVALQNAYLICIICIGLRAVTVMRLVIEDQDVLQAHQAGHHTLNHLAFSFQRIQRFAAALEQRSPTFRKIETLTKLEGMVIRNDDFGAVQIAEHVAGNQLTVFVVAVRVVRLEDAEPVADGQAGSYHQKTAREPAA